MRGIERPARLWCAKRRFAPSLCLPGGVGAVSLRPMFSCLTAPALPVAKGGCDWYVACFNYSCHRDDPGDAQAGVVFILDGQVNAQELPCLPLPHRIPRSNSCRLSISAACFP